MTANSKDFKIIGKGSFLECVQYLKDNKCDAIYGPSGGILVLDEHNGLVYNTGECPENKIYFSADCYLGEWRLLNFISPGIQVIMYQFD